jgi:hypothetical protein
MIKPMKNSLMPSRVPKAQAPERGNCAQIMNPSKTETIPPNSSHPPPVPTPNPTPAAISDTPSRMKYTASKMVSTPEPTIGLVTRTMPATTVSRPTANFKMPLPRLPAWKAQIIRMMPPARTTRPRRIASESPVIPGASMASIPRMIAMTPNAVMSLPPDSTALATPLMSLCRVIGRSPFVVGVLCPLRGSVRSATDAAPQVTQRFRRWLRG